MSETSDLITRVRAVRQRSHVFGHTCYDVADIEAALAAPGEIKPTCALKRPAKRSHPPIIRPDCPCLATCQGAKMLIAGWRCVLRQRRRA